MLTAVSLSALLGCTTTTEYRMFEGHFKADEKELIFQREAGDNALFEVFRFSGTPFIPGAFGGYSLFIEGSQGLFQEGLLIRVPDKSVQVAYYSDYHHQGRVEREASGTILVHGVSRDSVRLEINLVIVRTGKAIRVNEEFLKQDIQKYSERLP